MSQNSRNMKMMATALAAVVAIMSFPASAQTDKVSIVCRGSTTRQDDIAIFFKMEGGAATIKVPSRIFNVKDDRWLPVDSLKTEGNKIFGRVKLSFWTNPRLSIDRTTGEMNFISEGGLTEFAFTGSCEPYSDEARKF